MISRKLVLKSIVGLLLFLGVSACQTPGCTDPIACNFDPNATQNNGTCDYSCLGNNCTGGYIIKSGSITADETWPASCVIRMAGNVIIENGVTVTIEPGAIIKADNGTGSLATNLIVAQGGQLIANGTATQPIIFTSINDDIQLGATSGSNLTIQDVGLWGGVIILGNAPISDPNNLQTSNVEGLLPGNSYSEYGGNDPLDNSGSMNYVSIRHGGTLIGAGNEVNGLTLAAVGSGTQISNIEIFATLDDGIEFFGGTVNVSNIAVGIFGDDGIDIDQGYDGAVDNFIVCKRDQYSDEGLEVDGPEGSLNTNGMFSLTNGTIINDQGNEVNADFKSGAQGSVSNTIINGNIKLRASYTNNCNTASTDALTNVINGSPVLVFNGCQFTTVNVYTQSYDAGNGTCPVPTSDQNSALSTIQNGSATGADMSAFGWTWLSANGYF